MRALPPGRALSSRAVTVSFSFGRCMHAPHGASVIPLAAPVSTRGNRPLIPPHSTSVHRLGGSPKSTPPTHTHTRPPLLPGITGVWEGPPSFFFGGLPRTFQGTFLPPPPSLQSSRSSAPVPSAPQLCPGVKGQRSGRRCGRCGRRWKGAATAGE